LAAHLTLIREHMLRFIQSKGSCSHFHRFPTDMMEETIHLIKKIGSYNDRYREWIKSNEKNAQRYLKDSESVGVS
jgi:hypothetical protein